MRHVQRVLILCTCLLAAAVTLSHAQTWQHVGLDGKTVNAIVIDPTDPDVIFAGAEDSLYRSTDGGKVWDVLEPGLLRGVKDLSVERYGPTDFYAMRSTGDANDGVFRSTDGGESWNRVLDLACGTSLMGYSGFYAAALNDSAAGGVYFSSDHGSTWDTINDGLTNLDIQSLGAFSGYGDSVDVDFAGTTGGIFRRTTLDTSWSWGGPAVNASICDFSSDGHSCVYAAWGNGSWSDGVYKMVSLGEAWEVKHYQIYTRAVEINPVNCVTAYAGALGGGVFRSTDMGETWEEINQGLTDLDVIELAFCATDTTWLYAGTEGGGVFRFGVIPGAEERDRRESQPSSPRLEGICPSPFSTSTTISYFLPDASLVLLDIYDITGSHVETIVMEWREPGLHRIRWIRARHPSGTYFCRLKTGEYAEAKKVILLE